MPIISAEEIFRIAEDVANEKGVKIPKEAKADFLACLDHDKAIQTCADLTQYICGKIDRCLKQNSDKQQQYNKLLIEIRTETKFRVFEKLRQVDQILIQYLESLAPGQNWNGRTLMQWQQQQRKQATSFDSISFLSQRKFTIDVVKRILGDRTEHYLKRNPFTHNTKNKEEYEDAALHLRRSFKEFMAQLPKGTPWCPQDYRKWNRSQKPPLKIDEARVIGKWEYILANVVDPKDIEEHPFNKKKVEKWTDGKIRKTLTRFFNELRSSKIKTWSFQTLYRWRWEQDRLGFKLLNAISIRGPNWLVSLITYTLEQDLRHLKFTHKYGKQLPEAPLNIETSVHSRRINTSEAAYIRGNDSYSPEFIYAEVEIHTRLQEAIANLSRRDKGLVKAFLDGRTQDIENLIPKLRSLMANESANAAE